MRQINQLDSNGVEIFEGDTLLFNDSNVFLEDKAIKYFKIDKVTATVLPMNGQTGVKLCFNFYSNNNEVYTYKEKKEYLIHRNPAKTDITNKWFDDLECNTDEPVRIVIDNIKNSFLYNNSFKQKDKIIIKSTLSKEEKDSILKENKEPCLVYGENQTASIHQSFLVELSKEAKERAIEVHNCLYETEHGYEGDFSYLKLFPEIQSDGEHRFRAIPVNPELEITWFYKIESWEKRKAYRKDFLIPLEKDLEKWIDENKEDVNYEEIKNVKEEAYNKKRLEIRDMLFLESAPVDDFFLGLAASDNLLTYFLETGSKITFID